MKPSSLPLALLLLFLSLAAQAASEAERRLDHFFRSIQSVQADFVQEVHDEKGRLLRKARGRFELLRPGRFRWDYTEPSPQQIVSDGQYLWIYDQELAQVTVKKLGKALGASPLLLLSEPRSVRDDFIITDTREHDGVAWMELIPKLKDTDFTRIEVGLTNEGVKEMHLTDQFGQNTVIRFEHLRINQPIDAGDFLFTPPPEADVLGLDAER